MTGPEDSHGSTRPISVAELLAKNGTIGAPPVGGRRRRRRGNSDSVTVAELTGEIPIAQEQPVHDVDEPVAASTNGVGGHDDEVESVDEPELAEDEYEDRGAEQMSPDPVDEDDELFDSPVDLAEEPEIEDEDTGAAVADKGKDEPPSYLRSSAGTLFGGQTVADDLARRGAPPRPEDIDLEDDEVTDTAPSGMSSLLRGAWVVGQCIIAVAFGAGLFIAFDQLWKWNNIIALVLSVLVILGLVVGVRVVRKTEDIGSTLIAVAVGALVTLGPLALLQSG
jgi:hypothetical protein